MIRLLEGTFFRGTTDSMEIFFNYQTEWNFIGEYFVF